MALLTPDTVYRLYETMGVPESGPHEPKKAEIVQLLKQMMSSASAPAVVTETKDALDLITPANEGYGGRVLNDPDPSKNGDYYRSGGEWVWGRGFPDTFASLTLSGTANAQVGSVSAGVNPADVLVFFATVGVENTGAMTLQIGDAPARDVVNAAGNPLSGGEWDNTVIFFLNDAEEYQLLFDPNAVALTAANVTVAQGLRDETQDLRDQAEAFAALSGPVGVYPQAFVGDGVETEFALTVAPISAAHLVVAIDGVLQDLVSYSVNDTTLTFTVAPPGDGEAENIFVRIFAISTGEDVPPDGSVTTPKLADNSTTFAKMQNISSGAIIGRATAGPGDPEEVPSSALGRSLLNAADAAAGRALLGTPTPIWEAIELRTISSPVAQADFVGLGDFIMLRAEIFVVPSTDAATFGYRTSVDNGAAFAAGASDYAMQYLRSASTTVDGARSITQAIGLLYGLAVGNVAPEGCEVTAVFKNFNKAKQMFARAGGFGLDGSTGEGVTQVGTRRLNATARNAIRFLFSTGNIASGFILLEGVRG